MIPQDVIDGYLSSLFGRSEPGQTMHHLLVATANPADGSVLGIPNLEVAVYAIAPTGDVDAEQLLAETIMTAIVWARRKGAVVHFAGLAMEVYTIADDGNEVTENRARLLLAERRLQEHPDAVEMTRLYAACRDGRRWTGGHILTGPKAGTVSGPHARVGGIAPQEKGMHQRLVRAAVGLGH